MRKRTKISELGRNVITFISPTPQENLHTLVQFLEAVEKAALRGVANPKVASKRHDARGFGSLDRYSTITRYNKSTGDILGIEVYMLYLNMEQGEENN